MEKTWPLGDLVVENILSSTFVGVKLVIGAIRFMSVLLIHRFAECTSRCGPEWVLSYICQ